MVFLARFGTHDPRVPATHLLDRLHFKIKSFRDLIPHLALLFVFLGALLFLFSEVGWAAVFELFRFLCDALFFFLRFFLRKRFVVLRDQPVDLMAVEEEYFFRPYLGFVFGLLRLPL